MRRVRNLVSVSRCKYYKFGFASSLAKVPGVSSDSKATSFAGLRPATPMDKFTELSPYCWISQGLKKSTPVSEKGTVAESIAFNLGYRER